MSPGERTGLWCPPEANLQKSDSKGSSTPGDTSTVSCMLPFFSFFLPAGSSQAVHNHGIAHFSLEESAKFTWEKRSQNPGASSTLVTNTLKGPSGNWHICGYSSHVLVADIMNQLHNTRPWGPDDTSESFFHLPFSPSKILLQSLPT